MGELTVKAYRKRIVPVIILSIVVTAFTALYIHMTYFPMACEVRITDKYAAGSAYYVEIITPGEHDSDYRAKFSCSKEEYDKVDTGDTVFCEFHHSGVTHKGSVHRFKLPKPDPA